MNRWTSMLGAALLVAFVATPAAAQFGGDREIGFKLGVNFSTLDGDGFDDADTRTAFTGGGFFRFGITPMLSVQPELMYSPKGAEFTETLNGSEVTTAIELDYIEVPLLLRADVATGSMLAPYIYGGPALAFEASCSLTGEVEGTEVDVDCDDTGEDLERKSFDAGAMVGGGLSFPAGPGSILIEGRYNWGLINLDDSDGEGDVKNRAGSVLAGYSISLGR